MDYIGSKAKLTDWIFSYVELEKGQVFVDACSGSGCMSRAAAQRGYRVLACDNMAFPKHLVEGSIGVEDIKDEIDEHVEVINNLEGEEGFFFQEYSSDPENSTGRMYLTHDNGKRIDATRQYICNLTPYLAPTEKLRSVLIYFSLEALSRVSNTAGTYGAYLKKFKARALNRFELRWEDTTEGIARAYHSDLSKFLETAPEYNLVYIDPPYTTRKYPPNYHLYETFANCTNPEVHGKTGLRSRWQEEAPSDFCNRNKAPQYFKKVVDLCQCETVLISYNSDGILRKEEFLDIFDEYKVEIHEKEWRRYKADSSRTYSEIPLTELLVSIIK